MAALPSCLQRAVLAGSGEATGGGDWRTPAYWSPMLSGMESPGADVDTPAHSPLVRDGLARVIKLSSRQQSLKGILTAGIFKSIAYGASKLSKARKKSK